MKILALEFSARARSVAVAEKRSDNSTSLLSSISETDFRGVTGMTLIDRAIKAANLKPSDISRIAIGLGPGSYTGIRSAIAIAQGWQLGRDIELVGISSISVLAEQARTLEIYGPVTIVVDAQRQELYAARYQIDPARALEVEALRIVPPSDISDSETILGAEATKFFPSARDHSPSAEILAPLASSMPPIPGEQLEPIYLRETTFVKAPVPRHIRT